MEIENADVLGWFSYKNLVHKSEDELKGFNNRLKRDIGTPRLKGPRKESDHATRYLNNVRYFLQDFANEVETSASSITPSTFTTVANFVLSIRIQLTKIQPLFTTLERALHQIGLDIRLHSIMVQLVVRIVGCKFYAELKNIVRNKFISELETMSTSCDGFYEFCNLFADIRFENSYNVVFDPTLISEPKDVDHQFILSIIRELVSAFKFQLQSRTHITNIENEAWIFMNYLSDVTMQIYPEEHFEVQRAAYLATFADIEFYKDSILQNIVVQHDGQNLHTAHCLCQIESRFSNEDLRLANLEITTKWVHQFLKGPDYQRYLIQMMDLVLRQHKSAMCSLYAFELSDGTIGKFMKLMVKHVTSYNPQSQFSPKDLELNNNEEKYVRNEEEKWLIKIKLFLKNSQHFQHFVDAFFEQYILKEIVRSKMSIEFVKSVLEGKGIYTCTALKRFCVILRNETGALYRVNKILGQSAVPEINCGVKKSIVLPGKLFPNIFSKNPSMLPFDLPEKWLCTYQAVTTDDGLNVRLYDQPHLHRVLVKASIFNNSDLSFDLNLCHAVILDTLFNKSISCSLDEAISTLSVRDITSFKNYLSTLVKVGLLSRNNNDKFAINTRFKPNMKLLVNGTLIIP
ncbi:unnamed protein product [Kluyveromyces dobzhanskii CBS 2104]|uniref:WGS project CCBQ000000000 data, contig 00272 n=1 Tax=Kluyveromyces dobzhanskii CBS 2104 TaxID=1427455 RepID=A0A0A8LB29_9SACH|nr:unnamed protein product [Kluyveromyces dobzhanskii CBS 2104]